MILAIVRTTAPFSVPLRSNYKYIEARMCDCLPGTILVNDLHNLYLSHVFEHFTILSEKMLWE